MEITEIRIKLMEQSEDRLRAFCSITINNAFVIRDLKIIDGSNGPFVAMPSRKLSGHCQRCRHKNHLRSHYCNHCGTKLQQQDSGNDSPQKLYADVAHPINSECREHIQNAVLTEFKTELARYQQADYRSRYDDEFGFEDVGATPKPSAETQPTVTDNHELSDAANASDADNAANAARTNTTSNTTEDETKPAEQETVNAPQSVDTPTAKQQRIDPPAAESSLDVQNPGKPHFADNKPEASSQREDDDSFGAGIL